MKAVIKIVGYLTRIPAKVRHRLIDARARRRCSIAASARIYPSFNANNNQAQDNIRVGAHSVLLCRLETLGHGGRIEIGANCFIGENTYIWSAEHITIGDRVLISHNVNIHDHNSHSLSATERSQHFTDIFTTGHPKTLENVPSRKVTIEDDAWIGFNATILKGVTIGRGAVVGACALVTKDVPPYTIVVGNPARAIGSSRP